MKKLIAFLVSIASVSIGIDSIYAFNLVSINKYTDSDGSIYEYMLYDNLEAYIRGIEVADGVVDLTIPNEVDGYKVTKIIKNYAKNTDKVKSINVQEGIESVKLSKFPYVETITLPSTLISLDEGAFSNFKSLKNINLPESLKYIKAYSFEGCDSLESIKIPDGVNEIWDYAFYGCTNLSNVDWDKSASMGSFVFDGTSYKDKGNGELLIVDDGGQKEVYTVLGNLKTAEIPEGVTSIYANAFTDTSVEKAVIPSSVKEMNGFEFYQAKNLKEIEFKGKIERLGDATFSGCTELKDITLPDEIKYIPESCFWGCKKLNSIDIPSNVTEIRAGAFENCSGLENVKFSDTLNKIGLEAFQNCNSLKEIILPKSLEKIEAYAFENCKALTKLTAKGYVYIGKGAFVNTALKKDTISFQGGVTYEGAEKKEVYKNDPLSFLYDSSIDASEIELHPTKTPMKNDDETASKPQETVKPETIKQPQATIEPSIEPSIKPTSKPIIQVSRKDDSIKVTVENKKIEFTDAKPFIDENSRTQLPVRAVSENLGCKVEYDNANKIVTISRGNKNIAIEIGSKTIFCSGETIEMDTAAQIVNDRTYIPIRFIAEVFGYEVKWE